MLRRIVGWVVLVPLCLVMIVFALANRQLVVVNFNPLVPSEALTTPGVGVLLGGIATWFAQAPHRRDERAYKREAERLNREVNAIRRPSLTVDDLAKP